MIKLYVYEKTSGLLQYVDTGNPESVTLDIPNGHDFTLAPPPDFKNTWAWDVDKWVQKNTALGVQDDA